MAKTLKADWFTSWFDTSYYHLLYKDRDDEEAQLFMQNITTFLKLSKTSHILDIPCGKGRHAVYLNSLGYKVTGTDLSENSILHAQQFENKNLQFRVADMRKPLQKKYDAIFNLFTSFGYFDDDKIDIQILTNFKNGLKENGVAVIDFLNVNKVKNSLVEKEVKTIDNIEFHIQRKIENGFIIKEISFFVDDKNHQYTERVKFLSEQKMKNYLTAVGFSIEHTFGNYQLEPFSKTHSNRLIFVVR